MTRPRAQRRGAAGRGACPGERHVGSHCLAQQPILPGQSALPLGCVLPRTPMLESRQLAPAKCRTRPSHHWRTETETVPHLLLRPRTDGPSPPHRIKPPGRAKRRWLREGIQPGVGAGRPQAVPTQGPLLWVGIDTGSPCASFQLASAQPPTLPHKRHLGLSALHREHQQPKTPGGGVFRGRHDPLWTAMSDLRSATRKQSALQRAERAQVPVLRRLQSRHGYQGDRGGRGGRKQGRKCPAGVLGNQAEGRKEGGKEGQGCLRELETCRQGVEDGQG